MAGHYMLMYDDDQDCLVPMVWQDTDNPEVKNFSMRMAGDFPVRSLRYGLVLWKAYTEAGLDAEVALLVNDHQFQSKSFQPKDHDKIKGRGGELRRQYYRDSDPIPLSFRQLLNDIDAEADDVIMRRDDPTRASKEVLPRTTPFFSERVLRNRFDDKTEQLLIDDTRFEKRSFENRKSEFYYRPEIGNEDLCLTQDGNCSCSGEVIQFTEELCKEDVTNVVFFSPSECIRPVNAGIQAALYLNYEYRDSEMKVTTVSGIGGMGISEEPGETDPIEVMVHTQGDVKDSVS